MHYYKDFVLVIKELSLDQSRIMIRYFPLTSVGIESS